MADVRRGSASRLRRLARSGDAGAVGEGAVVRAGLCEESPQYVLLVTEPWVEPPHPPEVPDVTVAALADHCEAMGKHLLREVPRATEGSPDGLDRVLEAAHSHLMAARVLRETYDLDIWKYE